MKKLITQIYNIVEEHIELYDLLDDLLLTIATPLSKILLYDDFIKVICKVEETFNVIFTKEEITSIETIEDIYSLLILENDELEEYVLLLNDQNKNVLNTITQLYFPTLYNSVNNKLYIDRLIYNEQMSNILYFKINSIVYNNSDIYYLGWLYNHKSVTEAVIPINSLNSFDFVAPYSEIKIKETILKFK